MKTIDKKVNEEEKLNVKNALKKGAKIGLFGVGAYLASEFVTCNLLGYDFNLEYINSLSLFYGNIPKAFGIFGGLGLFYGLDE